MSSAARRAIGSLAVMAAMIVWIIAAATIGGFLAGAPWWAQAVFYAVAGIAWIFPLRPIFTWMGRPDRTP